MASKGCWTHPEGLRYFQSVNGEMPAPMAAGVATNECLVCGAECPQWVALRTPHGEFRIVRCGGCGFAFVNPRPTAEFLTDFYSNSGHGGSEPKSLERVLRAEQDYPNSTLDAQRLVANIHRFCGNEPYGGQLRLLDIGCGYGFFSRQAKVSGFEVTALEVASEEYSIAAQVAGLTPVRVSFEEFDGQDECFSALLMSQILEHALDVNLWIAKAYRLLKPSGVLAIALPNFGSLFRLVMQEKEPYICPPAHLNFFTIRSLSLLLERHGFHVVKTHSISRMDPSVILRRVPFSRVIGRGGARFAFRCCFAPLDSVGLGTMINLYAQKPAEDR
jgi:SAM-dependent methyltransferase